MKPVKCPNCGNEIAVDESSQYLSCGSCGKCYVNPFYVKKESSNATAEQSNQVEQNEKPKGSWRCVSCKAILPSDDSSPTLICPACGRSHKNPSYKPTQSAVVQENVVQNINNAKSIINNEQTVTVQQSVINAPPKVGESKFTGTYGSLLGHRIVNSLISIFTLGFGIPWVICRSHRWEVEHTVIDGRHLSFDGTGGKLIGAWIKWMFLTLITCGIYGLWVPLKKRAWIVEHSHIEGLSGESKFTGGLGSYIGLQIVNALIMIFTLGLGLPWVVCRTIKWDSEHQIIDGQRIYFDGKASQLFGNWIKWVLLTVVTLGIYSILIPIKKQAWIVKHQSFVKPMENSGQSTGKQIDVNNQKKKDIGKIVGCVLAVVCVIATIVAVCVTVIPTTRRIPTRSPEGLAYSVNNDGMCTIQGIGDCNQTDIVIPKEIYGYTVTDISMLAFDGCTSLTSIVIPDSVTSIGRYAFRDCTSLTSIVIPDSVTTIDSYAFSGCTSLTSITIPDSVTSIDRWTFRDCTSLTSITIPDSVTSIAEDAFEGCTMLTNVHYLGTLEQWCGMTFESSAANPLSEGAQLYIDGELLTKAEIPYTVTEIKAHAFEGCTSLTSIVIPDGVTSIAEDAFEGCTNIVKATMPADLIYDIPQKKLQTVVITSGDSIGWGAFYNCTSLTSITISDSVTSIGDWAFYGCSSLKSITIPDSVTGIGDYAFYNCSSLTSIVIPDSVTSLGNYAFYGCINIVKATMPAIAIEEFSSLDNLRTVVITSGTTIGWYAFYNCTSLTSIVIPDSVTTIDESAFRDCTSLTSIVIPDSVTTIGSNAFRNCDSLTSVTIGDSVTTIGEYAFDGCTSLTSVTFEDTTTWYRTTRYNDWQNKTGGTKTTVTDASTNATYFTSTYDCYYWYKV